MNPGDFQTLFDYSYWARDRLLAATEGITDEEFNRDLGFVYGGVAGIMRHCLRVERLYRTATLRGERGGEPLDDPQVATVEGLKQAWREEEALMREYVDGLTQPDLDAEVRLTRRDGSQSVFERWQLLLQAANHGTQHRAEAAEALTKLGRSPGDLDIIRYFMSKQVTA